MQKYLMLITILLFTANVGSAADLNYLFEGENPTYKISITHGETYEGDIILELYPDVAPEHVRNFDSLVSIQFYDRTAFHRVIPNFMIQGGDPNSRDKPKSTWGYGDPSQRQIPAEFSNLKHVRGILSAARASDPNSATSQFFICVVPYPSLDGQYSIYGEVIEGMDVVDYIVNTPRDSKDNPYDKVEMTVTKLGVNSIDDNISSGQTIRIFPNPTDSYVNIRLNRSSEYYIMNILGKKVLSGKLNNGDTQIDISNLPSGAYYLYINGKAYKILRRN